MQGIAILRSCLQLINVPYWAVFGLLVMVTPSSYGDTDVSLNIPATSQRFITKHLLYETGVQALLQQLPDLIEEEMNNLQSSALSLTPAQWAHIHSAFNGEKVVANLKHSLLNSLQKDMGIERLQQIKQLLQVVDVVRFKHLKRNVDNESAYARIRQYKAMIDDKMPLISRVQLIERLDDALWLSRLEAEMKVALRKNLLATVSWVTEREVFSEEALEQEMMDYRQRVAAQIDDNARVYYLYLLKATTGQAVRSLTAVYQQPQFEGFMKQCESTILDTFQQQRIGLLDQVVSR